MAIEFETPGMKIPMPTAAQDGYVLGYDHATFSIVWQTASAQGATGASGFSGYSGTSGFSGI